MQDITSLYIVGRLPSVVYETFYAKYHLRKHLSLQVPP